MPKSFVAGLLLSFASLTVACSSTAPTSTSGSQGTANAPTFDGTYVPTTAGDIASVTFSAPNAYSLQRTPCGDDSCVETEKGTYSFDAAHGILSLTDGATGKVTIAPVSDLSTSPSAPSSSPSYVDDPALHVEGLTGGPIPLASAVKQFGWNGLVYVAGCSSAPGVWECYSYALAETFPGFCRSTIACSPYGKCCQVGVGP